MSERFLVATDFSSDADQALRYAMVLGTAFGAHLIVIHVRDDTALNPLAYSAQAEAETRQVLERLLEPVYAAGLTGEIVLIHGVPWREICHLARERQATLILMGTHGRTGLSHLWLGSVTENVVRHASCPVLVTRDPKVAS
jgi:nucleotide-binding universal stress UspA family protein